MFVVRLGKCKMKSSRRSITSFHIPRSFRAKLETDLQKLGLKIKHHEDNLKFLKSLSNSLDESILSMQITLGKHLSSDTAVVETPNTIQQHTEQQILEKIVQQEGTAAGILCKLKIHHGEQAPKLAVTKDTLGIVATLGKVKDANLSRLLSEYLGLETMLAIVCKTDEGVKALEIYDKTGVINMSTGLHGLGPSLGRRLEGRFNVICLEYLRPYSGNFIEGDPQKGLDLFKPKLSSGECPPGFLGYAVNMIDIETMHSSHVTANGHGLRETLFYSLFSRLQVYRTRSDMQRALPFISDGAISLDGGMMKSTGFFSLGIMKDLEVNFPISSGSRLFADIDDTQEKIRLANWEKERLAEDMQREEALLNHEKNLFSIQKQKLSNYISLKQGVTLVRPII